MCDISRIHGRGVALELARGVTRFVLNLTDCCLQYVGASALQHEGSQGITGVRFVACSGSLSHWTCCLLFRLLLLYQLAIVLTGCAENILH